MPLPHMCDYYTRNSKNKVVSQKKQALLSYYP